MHPGTTDLRCLPEPITHVLSQQSSHIVAELHTCTLGHEFDRLPGNLGEAALLPVRHAHGDHSETAADPSKLRGLSTTTPLQLAF